MQKLDEGYFFKILSLTAIAIGAVSAVISGTIFYLDIPLNLEYSLGRYVGALAVGSLIGGIWFWRSRARAREMGINVATVPACVLIVATLSLLRNEWNAINAYLANPPEPIELTREWAQEYAEDTANEILGSNPSVDYVAPSFKTMVLLIEHLRDAWERINTESADPSFFETPERLLDSKRRIEAEIAVAQAQYEDWKTLYEQDWLYLQGEMDSDQFKLLESFRAESGNTYHDWFDNQIRQLILVTQLALLFADEQDPPSFERELPFESNGKNTELKAILEDIALLGSEQEALEEELDKLQNFLPSRFDR